MPLPLRRRTPAASNADTDRDAAAGRGSAQAGPSAVTAGGAAMTPDRRQLFLARYQRLLGHARGLLGDRVEQAQDLVHDAFVQFVLGLRPLDTIEDLDAYLYGMLRKLHLARLRRLSRHPVLSLADYDSVRVGLHALDGTAHIHALHDLASLGRYACVRKESSSAASIFILRFFWSCPPPGVALLANASPMAVAQRLRRARIEARAAIEAPQRLAFLPPRESAPRIAVDPTMSMDEAQGVVLDAIVGSCRGACFTADGLAALYADPATPLPTPALAHLASCPRCLDRAARHRSMDDGLRPAIANELRTSGPRRPEAGPRGRGRGRRGETPGMWLDAVQHHRPGALFVFANGFLLGSQRVTGAASELTVSARADEPLACIEILSEQGVLLLFLDVESPFSGAVRQEAAVAFGAGRSLSATIDFSSTWPLVRVCYVDPEWTAAPARLSSAVLTPGARTPAALTSAGLTSAGLTPPALTPPALTPTAGRGVQGRAARRGDDVPFGDGASDPASSELRGGDDVSRREQPLRRWCGRWYGRWDWPWRWHGLAWRMALAVFVAWLAFGGGAVTLASGADRVWQWVVRLATAPAPASRSTPAPSRPPAASPPLLPPAQAPTAIPGGQVAPPSPPPAAALSDAALVGLEMLVLERLDAIGALLGEQIDCTRAGGLLRVSAIVDDDARALVVRRALAPLADRPGLLVRVRTAREVAPAARPVQEGTRGPVVVQEYTVDGQRSAMQDDLRAHVTHGLDRRASSDSSPPDSDAVERATRDIGRDIVVSSHRALRETWALQRLVARFSAADLDTAPDGTRAVWQRLAAGHVAAYRRDLHALAAALAFAAPAAGAPARGRVSSGDVHAELSRLVTLAADIDRAVQASFRSSASAGTAAHAAPVKTAAFWQDVSEARELTAALDASIVRPE